MPKLKSTTISKKKTDKETEKNKLAVWNVKELTSTYISAPTVLLKLKINKNLLSQAARVYLSNLRFGLASTKTRGEVAGSTRKIYRQKGTGRARHGSLKAPVFVGGGIVFGPRPRNFHLNLNQKMRHQALLSALSAKLQTKDLTVINHLSDISKTREIWGLLKTTNLTQKSVLVVLDKENYLTKRMFQNIDTLKIVQVENINALDILKTQHILLTEKSLKHFEQLTKITG